MNQDLYIIIRLLNDHIFVIPADTNDYGPEEYYEGIALELLVGSVYIVIHAFLSIIDAGNDLPG